MRTVRNVVGILFGSIALATCACSPTLSPTTPQVTPPGQAAIQPKDRESALAVIERAIQAQGGKALARTSIMVRDGVGTTRGPKGLMPFTDHTLFAFPDRANVQLQIGVEKLKIQKVVNGSQAWEAANNQTNEVMGPELDTLKQNLYMAWLTTLTPLESDSVEVGILEDGKVGDRPVAVVRVKASAKIGILPEFHLSFDKETGLLVKVRWAGLNKEHLYSDYKDFDGVKMPTREQIMMNGEQMLDVTITSWKFPAKADEVEFQKP